MGEAICSVDDCVRLAHARGYCGTHYARWRRYGEPVLPTAEERFWSKVECDGPIPVARPDLGPCWIWTGATQHGYGSLRINTVGMTAHRVTYEWLVGPIPDGLQIDHLCRVRPCVRPSHMEPVTQAENIRRGEAGRYPRRRCERCKRGHAMTPENTYESPGGQRQCRACNALRRRGVWDSR